MAALSAPPLSLDVDGSVWTILRDGATVCARPGTVEDALVVTLSPAEFSDWAQNQITFNGLLVARTLQFRGGTLRDISIWDSLWITMLEGWPTVEAGLVFLDRSGAPLDLNASFTSRDDPAEIAHFLREAGYLHLRGWFDPADMAAIAADMDRALPHYAEGDGKSWWAGMNDGSRRCVRLQEFIEHSPTTARILSSDAWQRMRQIVAGQNRLAHVPVEGRIIEALFKPVGVKSGPSDVSFHRDCHLGRHAYVCARMTVGIALTPTSEANGLLRVVAGSHRVAMPVEIAKTEPYLPVVALPTEPGDLTVHLSCTLHESRPPVFAERRVMYTEMPLEPLDANRGAVDTSVGELRERVSDILRRVDGAVPAG
ncbi:phytanoyl-CoA dioxygenase family protein [Sphingomonas cavernae]|nr:phytanoyl-CoA dioxygenase family protein [Sphingomonas cavernae]